MVPALTALAQTAAQPPRRASASSTCRTARSWSSGRRRRRAPGFEFTPILKPLEPFRDSLVVVSNLARAGGRPTGDHAVSAGRLAERRVAEADRGARTSAPASTHRSGASPSRSARTRRSRRSSWRPRTSPATSARCDAGYSCAYMNTHLVAARRRRRCRWRSTRAWCSSGCSAGRARADAARWRACSDDRSILDSVARATRRDLQRGLGARDRARLERVPRQRPRDRAAHPARRGAAARRERDRAGRAGRRARRRSRSTSALMFDLLALAFQADLTRVFTFMMAREVSQRTYPQIGVTEPHHASRTTATTRRRSRKLAKINTYHVQLFAKFLEQAAGDAGRRRLAARSLADRLRQRHEQRNAHAADPLPLRRGRRRRGVQGQPPHRARRARRRSATCWLTRGAASSAPRSSTFGDSTGRGRAVRCSST